MVAAAAWVTSKAVMVRSELEAASDLLPALKSQLATNDASEAARTVESLVQHTGSAREASSDPVWKAAAMLPVLGPNLEAASVVATSADDVARLGAVPMVKAFQSLNWEALTPSAAGVDLGPVQAAAPSINAAAHAVRESSKRLDAIDAEKLMPQIAGPLTGAREELASLSAELDSASDAAALAPSMLGADGPRRYLLLMQNNAEARATGGIPGALAVLSLEEGRLKLESQTSATALGAFVPPIPIDAEQTTIFSPRVGRFMQDVNLTPDFATTASTAQAMWKRVQARKLTESCLLIPSL